MSRGTFIVVEGLDGAGTTTQVELITEGLGEAGVGVFATSNPSNGPLGRMARDFLAEKVPLSERVMAMVFSGDRLDHYEREIEPHLANGDWVICDRYYLSTLTYQAVGMSIRDTGPRPDVDWSVVHGNMAWVYELNRQVARPDLTVSLGVDRAERESRMGASPGHRERYDLGEAADRLDESYDQAMKFLEDRGEEFLRVEAGGRQPREIATDITRRLLERWGG